MMTVALVVLGIALLILLLFLVSLSRHKKSGTGAIDLIGATGQTQSALDPEGAVLINGELWRARVQHGRLESSAPIRVIGSEGHLLVVEPE
jgi:membrane-bound ClpP family serine protease